MKVEYNLNHVYKEWSKDSGDNGSFKSAATVFTNAQDCSRTTKVTDQDNKGKATLEFDLGTCGEMTQSNGKIIYTVTIAGQKDGSHSSETLKGVTIYTTQDLKFTAECQYEDHQEVHKDMSVGTMTVDAEKQTNTGNFVFEMNAHVNNKIISTTNKPNLGDRVTFSIEPKDPLPRHLRYFLQGCYFKQAQQKTYILEKGVCNAKVINVEAKANGNALDKNGMKLREWVDISFDAFHTSNAGGNIELFCELKLCKDNGKALVDGQCSGLANEKSDCGTDYEFTKQKCAFFDDNTNGDKLKMCTNTKKALDTLRKSDDKCAKKDCNDKWKKCNQDCPVSACGADHCGKSQYVPPGKSLCHENHPIASKDEKWCCKSSIASDSCHGGLPTTDAYPCDMSGKIKNLQCVNWFDTRKACPSSHPYFMDELTNKCCSQPLDKVGKDKICSAAQMTCADCLRDA